MKRNYSITIKGKSKTWSFPIKLEESYLQEWRDDGLEIDIICNTIPVWVVNLGLLRVWIKVQDAWQLMRLF